MSEPTTAGRWTTEPPTVPGWYWWRFYDVEKDETRIYPVREGSREYFAVSGEWWTIPIQEPPR